MRRLLLRSYSLCKFNYATNYSKPNSNYTSLISFPSFSLLKFRLFSSKNLKKPSHPVHQSDIDSASYVEDVSNEELKRRIEKFYDGDEDAIPSILEAILKRKLAGKHDESDEELMEEYRHSPLLDDDNDKQFNSDSD